MNWNKDTRPEDFNQVLAYLNGDFVVGWFEGESFICPGWSGTQHYQAKQVECWMNIPKVEELTCKTT